MKKIAAIFDMDGTLIDNNPYHLRAWRLLFKNHGLPELTPQIFNEKMSGVPGVASLRNVLGDEFTEAELQALFDEKSEMYKAEYAPHIMPINGLERFLAELKDAGMPMGVATSAAPANMAFAFSHLSIGPYFEVMINGARLSKGKPDPQIFLMAAHDLGINPANCVVFEDSISGVTAARSAGMKIVAITTTHTEAELPPVDLVINDYADININKLAALFD